MRSPASENPANQPKPDQHAATPADVDWMARNIPCREACPAQTDIPGYLEAISKGDFESAFAINRRDNVFPHVLGRVCTRPCEGACRHGWEGLGDSVAICHSKRIAGDYRDDQYDLPTVKWFAPSGKRVAIVGAGVAGLTCARNLALLGHAVVVYEAHERPGGMLVQGIPEFRLPRGAVAKDIAAITALGVEIRCCTEIGKDLELAQLKTEYDAVVLAAGTPVRNLPDDIAGIEGPGIEHGLDFLLSVNERGRTAIEGPVIVIGGGFTAIDCARTALRLGGGTPAVFYRRAVSAIRVTPGEIEEMEHEGISITGNARPIAVIRLNGTIRALRMIRTRTAPASDGSASTPFEDIPGSEFEVAARTILLATGQTLDETLAEALGESVFLAGDGATGSSNLIRAIGHAKQVVEDVDQSLMHTRRRQAISRIEHGRAQPRTREMDEWPRHEMPALPLKDRLYKAEVETGLAEQDGIDEAFRCYLCHYQYEIDVTRCIYCDQCVEVKPRPACIVKLDKLEKDTSGIVTGMVRHQPDLRPPGTPLFYYIDQEQCIRCNACLEVCPTDCISVRKVCLEQQAKSTTSTCRF